jgi:hypothetical protein
MTTTTIQSLDTRPTSSSSMGLGLVAHLGQMPPPSGGTIGGPEGCVDGGVKTLEV